MRRVHVLILIALFLLFAGLALGQPAAALGPPIPGYWQGWGHYIPCSMTIPYNEWTEPGTGTFLVMQYPVTVWAVDHSVPDNTGSEATVGGSDHTAQVMKDGAPIPLKSGLCDVTPLTCPIYGAPYEDAPALNPGGKTLCEKYTSYNPPGRAKPCPSNQTKVQYGQTIAQSPQWTGNWNANAAERAAQCNVPLPTKTKTKVPTTPSKTPTVTPIAVNPYAKHIEALARAGITGGCGAGKFCPQDKLTREQAAVWFVNALHLQLLACENRFLDVPCAP